MPFEPPGLVKWAVDTRLAMLDDPGRLELQNDIAMHGYRWLDEYWDNILQGQNESLVELVKTPAKKKSKKKEKVAKLKPIPDEHDKENTPQFTSPRRDPLRPIRTNNILRVNDHNSTHNPFLEASTSPKSKPAPLMQAMIKEKASEETLLEHMKIDPRTPASGSMNDHPNQIAFKPLTSGKHTPAQAQTETPVTAPIPLPVQKSETHTPAIEDDTTTSTIPRSASPTATLTFSSKLDHTTSTTGTTGSRLTLNHRSSVQTLPALPQLSPLRKSTVRGTSLAPTQPTEPDIPGVVVNTGTTISGTGTGVQGVQPQPSRSSWLVKARAASSAGTALHGLPNIQPAPIPAGQTRFAPKRKINALNDGEVEGTEAKVEKNPKHARHERQDEEEKGKGEPSRVDAWEVVRGPRAQAQTQAQIQTPTEEVTVNFATTSEQPTTILESLKRKVEGISTRFLKSSISGVAAGGLGGIISTPPLALKPVNGGPSLSVLPGASGLGSGTGIGNANAGESGTTHASLALTGSKSLGGAHLAAQEARAAAMAKLELRQAMEWERLRPVPNSVAVAAPVEKELEPEPEQVFQPIEKKEEKREVRSDRGQNMEKEEENVEEEEEINEDGPVFKPLGVKSKERERQAEREREEQRREKERREKEYQERREQERREREREQHERREQERRERERERVREPEPEPEPESIFHLHPQPSAPAPTAIKNSHQTQLHPRPLESQPSTHSTLSSLYSTQSSAAPSVFDNARHGGRVNELGELASSQDTNAETAFTQPTQYSQFSQFSQPQTQLSQDKEKEKERDQQGGRDEDEWMGQPPPFLRAFMEGGASRQQVQAKEKYASARDDTLHTADLRPLTVTSGLDLGAKNKMALDETTSDEEDGDEGDVAVELDVIMGAGDEDVTSEDDDVDMGGEEEVPTVHAHNTQLQGQPKAPSAAAPTNAATAPVPPKAPAPRPRTLSKMASQDTSMSSVTSMTSTAAGMKKSFTASKNGKGLKSIQLAAVAAKKQQEEASKKAARLKEMENRRQQILQKKQDEERSRAALQDKKNKEEAEKRRKEREEFNEKRAKLISAKAPGSDDEATRRNQPARPGKPILGASTTTNIPSSQGSQAAGGPVAKPGLKPPSAAIPASTAAFPTIKLVPSSSNLKASVASAGPSAPSQGHVLKHKSSTATLKAVAVESAQAYATGPSVQPVKRVEVQQQVQQVQETVEYIDLPSIRSEYSDEDDVEHQLAKKALQPEWAQSPELARALADQEHINPYHIFGDIQPLRMEEIFRNRQGRFRNRSSSANWITAGDAVTMEEEIDYARRMGFQS